MEFKTFQFINSTGWSVDPLPKLDSHQTLVLAFCSPSFFDKPQLIQELRKTYPHAVITGCSTSGEIFNDQMNDNSISVAVLKFEKTKIKLVTESIKNMDDSYKVGNAISNQLKANDLKAIFILSDGLMVNGSALVEGLKKNLPKSTIITGGLAGDGKEFKKTWVLKEDKPTTQCIAAIGFYGEDFKIGFGCKGGWDVFGPERKITKSVGNVLYEIDDQPALTLYKKYLGERAHELPAAGLLFPLAINENPSSKDKVVRTILSINEEENSMTFAGEIPQGWYAQLMKANFDRLVEGASNAGKKVKDMLKEEKPNLSIAISCVGRRLVLGQRTEEELEATLEILGSNTSMIGFYSYGEISPSGLTNCDLHNQTMTLTTIYEK